MSIIHGKIKGTETSLPGRNQTTLVMKELLNKTMGYTGGSLSQLFYREGKKLSSIDDVAAFMIERRPGKRKSKK